MERSALIDCHIATDKDLLLSENFGPIYTVSAAHAYSLAGSPIGSYSSLHMRALSHIGFNAFPGGGLHLENSQVHKI